MYFHVQRICALAVEAARPLPSAFDPETRLRNELRRVLWDVPDDAIPADLREAVITGVVVGKQAATWLPALRQWLAQECNRAGV